MTQQMSMEDVLSGKEEVVEPEAPEATTEAAEPEEVEAVEEETKEVTDEPTEPTGVEETATPVVEDVKQVPLAAMLDERDKRKELQAKLEAFEAAKASEQKEKVDFWENPEAAVDAKVEARVAPLVEQFSSALLSQSMQTSRYHHKDFDTVKDAFAEAAKQNPALAEMALNSEMPGEYIYNTGKQFMELESVGGDVGALRERIRNEERAKLMAEFETKSDALKDIPVPLTNEQSATAPRQKVEGGVEPLESIFKHNSG